MVSETFRVPAVPDEGTPPLTDGCAASETRRVPAVPDEGPPPLTGGRVLFGACCVPALALPLANGLLLLGG